MEVQTQKSRCNGCGACVQICPIQCITMKDDREGFFYPMIDKSRCIDCQKCKEICENNVVENTMKPISYAVKNRSETIRTRSSSGGVFHAFAKYIIEQDGTVFGARYDDELNVYHASAECMDDVYAMMGSKYVQSDTQNTYIQVKALLEEDKWVLYTGTPCQISGLKKFLDTDYNKLVCVALICHGVPSPGVWKRYLAYEKGRNYESRIKNITFRDKLYGGWGNLHLAIEYDNRKVVRDAFDDKYYEAFLRDLILRPSCYKCRDRGKNNVADIIIGDFWGVEKYLPEIDDAIGVSAVIIKNSKGERFFSHINNAFEFYEVSYNDILSGNPMLEKSPLEHNNRGVFFELLEKTNCVSHSLEIALKNGFKKEERYIYQFPLMREYLMQKILGKGIGDILKLREIKKVALYAVAEFTEIFWYDLLADKEIKVVSICDKSVWRQTTGFLDYEVISPNEMILKYNNKEFDAVIVCSVIYENNIFQELQNHGVLLEDIISATELVYSLKGV